MLPGSEPVKEQPGERQTGPVPGPGARPRPVVSTVMTVMKGRRWQLNGEPVTAMARSDERPGR